MARLSARERATLPDRAFAYVDITQFSWDLGNQQPALDRLAVSEP